MGWYTSYNPNKSTYLTESQKTANVDMIHNWAASLGWSDVSLAGMLGCIENESGINPGAQNFGEGASWRGIGLCQWTNSRHTNLLNTAAKMGKNWWDPQPQLQLWETELKTLGFGVYYQHAKAIIPARFRFKDGIAMAKCKDPAWTVDMATAWWLCAFEMGGGSSSTESYWNGWWKLRQPSAHKWYEYLTGHKAIPSAITAYDAATYGITSYFDVSSLDINPYIATISRNTSAIDYTKLKDLGVVGVNVEAGYLYDVTHTEVSFRNPKLGDQIEAINRVELPFALYTIVRARSVEEAQKELYQLSFCIRKYPPKLGVWLKLKLTQSKSTNDKIIDTYYKELVRLGLKGKIGFYVSKSELSQISWDNHCDDWYLWLDAHMNSLETMLGPIDPHMFVLDEV